MQVLTAKAVFDHAHEIAARAERMAYVDQACADVPDLREKVLALLQAYDEAGGSLDPPRPAFSLTSGYSPAEGPGSRIGRYKLLQQIGEGGMGVVFMAEQQEPVRRKVALKIIKPGMDSGQILARFEAEQQALALMDHQNIARVLDAGSTESGRPYFVMELVHGVPITQFCDDNKLTPRERLALFVPVCQAIQHAHQKGIIHRDVKPSNVLVTMYDDKPVPKVIDFGVARAIEQRLTDRTMFTQFGTLIGTFEYMSPEQAEMNAFGVDTRSDIYSLGVLLYELLTGTTPLERTRLRDAALDEMVRLIKEDEAPRPSVRLSNSNNLPKIAAARKTEPARLSTLVRGEIDWIVMKCLEKDRVRRYDTASSLARDVERYLADEPVEACPPSARYRFSKFARKYKKALATAGAFVGVLVAGVVLSTLLAVWATSAEREANRQRIASEAATQVALDAKQEALDAKLQADKQRDEARRTAYASAMQLAQRAWEENDVIRARELLEEVPKEAGGNDLRGFEWYYLSRLCHPDELTLTTQAGLMCSVAFSPDGMRLASPSRDHTVKILDSATGEELASLGGGGVSHDTLVGSVAFSPDGQRLVSMGFSNEQQVWDIANGKELTSRQFDDRASSVESGLYRKFRPDGQRLVSAGGVLNLLDSETGNEVFALKGNAGWGRSVAFSPDGQRLATGGIGTVKIWESATGKELLTLKGHAATKSVVGVAFSPDGQRLASGSMDHTVIIWESATGTELVTLRGHTEGVNCVAFSPDGQRLASGSDDHSVKVWDTATGQELFALKGHSEWVVGLAFSPDGQRLASVSDDFTVKIWDVGTSNERFALKGHAGEVNCLAFSPDGQRLASGGYGKRVKIWDRATGKKLLDLEGGDSGRVTSVAFSPDGRQLALGSDDQTVKIRDSATGKELRLMKGHSGGINCVAFSPDGQRLVSADHDSIKIWDSATGKELFSLEGLPSEVASVAFSPDGQRLVSGHGDPVFGGGGAVKIWEIATRKELFTLAGNTEMDASVAFSPDGKRVASGNLDHTVRIWDSPTGKELFTLKGHARAVTSLAFSPDGQRLASAGGDGTVRIWDSATGKELIALKGRAGWARCVAFSPDGKCVASANDDGPIHLWETSVTAEVQDRRAANQLVADLFRQRGLRADVLEWLRTTPGMSPSRRQEALTVAGTYPEDPRTLDHLARERVRLPGGEMSGYRQALGYSEEACQREPQNGNYLNTLGIAYYRLGNYEKALETLLLSEPINKTRFNGSIPADLAFLAMTRRRLGHAGEAQAALLRLRERMNDPRWAEDDEARGFLHEAEALLANPIAPHGK